MAYFLLLLLIATALAMLCWGLSRRNGLLIYPTLAAGAWLGFVVPRFIGVMANPGRLPAGVWPDRGVELTLLMCVLCAAMSFVGYLKPPRGWLPNRGRQPRRWRYSSRRLFQAGLVLTLIGLVSFYRLTRLSGGILAHFSTEGHYSLEWRGLPVMYAFFIAFSAPGLILCLVATLHSPSRARWAGVMFAAIYPITRVVLLGRRAGFFTFALIVVLALYFVKRFSPPRWLIVPAVAVSFLVVQLAPAYRTYFRIGAETEKLREIDPMRSTEDVFRGERGVTETEYAVVQIAATHRAGRFNYGTNFYNRIIKNWIPRLIFSDAFKESLFLPRADHHAYMERYYGYEWPYGSFPTGYMDAFREFWFFGALIFYVIGAGFRALWMRADRGGLVAQILYIYFSYFAMSTVFQGVTALPSRWLRVALWLVPTLLYARAGVAVRSAAGPAPASARPGKPAFQHTHR
ncbi:MAG: O-antigen polymerase [bacterium]